MEIFEEEAIESTPCKPKIRERYVDDTFTILDRDGVDSFLARTPQQSTADHPGNQERQQDRLSRRVCFKRTGRPPYQQRLLEANSHSSDT